MRVWLLVLPLLQASLLTYDGTQSFTESLHFALFHVSWCTHCKQVKPAFTAAALQTSLRFLLVDCEAYADLCKGMKINSFPTLRLFVKGEGVEYAGGRLEEDFEEFAEKISGGVVRERQFEDWRREIGKQTVSFTLLFNPTDPQSKPLSSIFRNIADRMKYQTVFFYQTSYTETKVVVSGKDYREGFELERFSERELVDFIELHRLPIIVEMGKETFPLIKLNSKAKLLMILAFDSHDLDSKYNLDPFFALARGYRRQGNRKVQFCFIEAMYSSEQLEPFELSSVPAVIALDVRTEQVLFSVLSAPNSASAEKFTTRILKGEEALTPLELGYYYYAKKIVFAFLSSEFIYENPIFCFLALLSLSVCIGICAGELTKEKEE